MFLKRLEIQGFKSFAEKIDIEVQNGITGVVGPNGSGKSNIADSVRWVLGEQSAKSLRGGKMEDVIFAGTDKRKPLGFAEVTLVMDNKDNQLPLDYSEVSVTRRVFRSGESEYYINKTACRLKDIRELFMDTGVGKDGYSIVGQGRIDEILSNKSEDRRHIFEEAAGIVKFKTRKEESEKKLEKTKVNLIRIRDIINELDSQVEPLRKQSHRAKRYMELREKLKKYEVDLFVKEIEKLREQIELLNNQKVLIEKQLNNNEEHRDSLERKYNKVKNEIEKMDHHIEEIQDVKYTTQNKRDKIEADLRVYHEKTKMLEKDIIKLKKEINEIKQRFNQLVEDYERIIVHKKEISKKLEVLDRHLKEKNRVYHETLDELESMETYIDETKSNVIETLNQITDIKNKIKGIDTFNYNIDKRMNQLEKELIDMKKLKIENENKLGEIRQGIRTTKNKLIEFKYLKENEESIKSKNEDEYNYQEKVFNDTKELIQGGVSRHALLKDMKNEYEGFYKSVKNTLMAVGKNKSLGKGVKGAVAELINVNKKYERAIEVALGSTMQNIITETEDDAKRIITYLKSKKMGRVTFLPISSIKGRSLNHREINILNIEKPLGLASDLVEYDKVHKNIVDYLLGRVVIVESIDDGIRISRQCNYSLKIVALDGDVINPGGSITGGSYNTNYTNILGRERQIMELEQEIRELNSSKSDLNDKLKDLDSEISASKNIITDLDEEMGRMKLSINTLENKERQHLENKIKVEDDIKKWIREKEQLIEERDTSNEDVKALEYQLKKLKGKYDTTQFNINDMVKGYEQQKIQRDAIQKEVTDIKIEIASYQQKIQSIEEKLTGIDEEKTRILRSIEEKEQQFNEDMEQIKVIKNTTEELNEEEKDLEGEILDYEIKLKEIKGEKNNYVQTFYGEQENLNEMNRKINDLQKSINTLEVKDTKYNTQLENIINKLWDEYELSYKMAQRYKREDEESVTKVQVQVRQLKNEIKTLGNINVGAIDEYKRVKERYEFLTEQQEDLIKAKDSLLKVIKEMEVKMKNQFVERFQIIREHFKEVFDQLFGGGKADIFLEDEENALTTGIEVIAQPPGKKLQRLSLLSGGEKALTAIALLFAILRTKPTPFCILDEIEAALDDANVYRFSEFLKNFSKETQFIVITHRKGTMESVDALYGVTMAEEGVSKLISVKLSDKLSDKAS